LFTRVTSWRKYFNSSPSIYAEGLALVALHDGQSRAEHFLSHGFLAKLSVVNARPGQLNEIDPLGIVYGSRRRAAGIGRKLVGGVDFHGMFLWVVVETGPLSSQSLERWCF
jgi:hypothetical protein